MPDVARAHLAQSLIELRGRLTDWLEGTDPFFCFSVEQSIELHFERVGEQPAPDHSSERPEHVAPEDEQIEWPE